MKYFLCFFFLLVSLFCGTTKAQPDFSNYQTQLREIYKELIEINTTASHGTTTAVNLMRNRLIAAGFPNEDVQVLGQDSSKANLVARFHGTGGQKPLLLLAHIDVVDAKKEDWSFDPFKLTERDGYFYGRGILDDKSMAAIWITNLILLKHENYIPDRDIIVCLSTDEETGDFSGVQWLLKFHPKLIDAELCLNECGVGLIENGKYLLNQVQISEKIYQSYRLEVTNKGGHSSLPEKENAINRLAEGIIRISKYQFPLDLNEGTRTYFKKVSSLQTGKLAEDMIGLLKTPPDSSSVDRLSSIPAYNAIIRTTCVATVFNSGDPSTENVLPQKAVAIVNCRIIPGESQEYVFQKLKEVLANDKIKITPIYDDLSSPPSPINPKVFSKIEMVSDQLWPGIPVIPIMSTYASDGLYLRKEGMIFYGVSGLFTDVSNNGEHGKDERIGVKQLFDSQYFLYLLVKELSSRS
jgi:acetylornithine deacetylase/succinyl-diaminopimelate desuccinylase-like protein